MIDSKKVEGRRCMRLNNGKLCFSEKGRDKVTQHIKMPLMMGWNNGRLSQIAQPIAAPKMEDHI